MTWSASPRDYGAAWRSRVGLSPSGSISILAVVAVVVFVTVPRIRVFAVHENQVDARSTVLALADALEAWQERAGPFDVPPPLSELAREPEVEKALSDGEFREDGHLLLHHGYLFRLVELPPAPRLDPEPGTVLASTRPEPAPATLLSICAWPWKEGACFLGTPDGRLFRHPNDPLRWRGPLARVRPSEAWRGWTELRP